MSPSSRWRRVDGFTSFIPTQVFGPDADVSFLNQIEPSENDADLPRTNCTVGEMFIAELAAPDRETSGDKYAHCLDLQRSATHSLRDGLINRAFDFPTNTVHTISIVQNGRTPSAQIDQYPADAGRRAGRTGWLPAGYAIVSVLVDDIARLPLGDRTTGDALTPSGGLYRGRKTRIIRGAAAEIIELNPRLQDS